MRDRFCKLMMALVLVGLGAGLGAAQLIHIPVLSGAAGQDLVVQANLNGASGSDVHVRLYYRAKGMEIYRSVEMEGSLLALQGSIPGDAVQQAGVEYYLEAANYTGGQKSVLATAPAFNPALQPIVVAVRVVSGGPSISPLSPQPDDTVDSGQPVITAAWSDADIAVDPSSA